MSAGQPIRVPRFLSCLVKGPLGCLAFLLGMLLAGILFLPFAGGRLVDRETEKWFAKHFAGTLELGDAWVGSLYDEQHLDRLILRDPGGDEVLRASLRAPPLSGPWHTGAGRPYHWGPVRMRIEVLRLVREEDGSTNLEQALRSRFEGDGDAADEAFSLGRKNRGFSTDVPVLVGLELVVDRLRYSIGNGKEEVLENLHLAGTLEWGPEEIRLQLDGGSPEDAPEPFEAHLALHRIEFGPRRPWSSTLAFERVPTDLARALCAALRPLAPFASARLEHLEWSNEGTEVVLRCEDEGARFELVGQEKDGQVLSQAGGALTLTLPCAHSGGRALLERILAPLRAPECMDLSGSHLLRLSEFAWPLDGDWSRLSGVLAPELAPLAALPSEALATWIGSSEPFDGLTLAPEARLVLREGELRYAGWRLASPQGWIQLDGTQDLEGGSRALVWSGVRDGKPLEPLHLQDPPDPRAAAESPEEGEPGAEPIPLPSPPGAPTPELPEPHRAGR